MKEAGIVEMVMFNTNENVPVKDGKKAMEALSDFVSQQPGFISRTTSVTKEGEFLDLVFWTNLTSAQTASEKAMKNETLLKHFGVIDQSTMTFKHFEVFHHQSTAQH